MDVTMQLVLGSSFEIISLAICLAYLIFGRPPLWARTFHMAAEVDDQEQDAEEPPWMKEAGIEQVR
eukprot:3790738-Pyramimonas_sp.AAC.1